MVRVLFYSDAHEQKLANDMCEMAIEQVQAEVAEHHFHFEPVIDAIDKLASRLTDKPPDVLVIVGHATKTGWVATQDIWAELDLEWKDKFISFNPELLADMLQSRGVSLVLAITCYGAVIARTLAKAGVVDVAAGTPSKLRIAAAVQFVRGAFRSLARGASPTKAVADARVWTLARMPKEHVAVEAFPRADARDAPLVQRPEIFIISAPGTHEAYAGFVTKLMSEMAGRKIFYAAATEVGGKVNQDVLSALQAVKMIILLFDGPRITDDATLDHVQAAVDTVIKKGGVRFFPLYLTGNQRSGDLPLGVRRLQPAFFEDPRIDRDVGKLAIMLEKLLNR